MTLLSPGYEARESTVQSTVVNNSTGRAGIAGKFRWGPALDIIQITDEVELVEIFGSPDDETADYFMSAMNFLQYGNDLRVVRAINATNAKNASPIVNNIVSTISAAGSNYGVGDKIRVKYLQNTVEENGLVTKVDADGKILSVFIPTKKIIAYAKSINQFPDLGSSWTAEVTSASSGMSATISLGKIETDSAIMIPNTDMAREYISAEAFINKIKAYNMPGVVALYPGELGSQIEVEIVSKAAYEANTQITVYPSGELVSSNARAVMNYGPETDDQYVFIVRRAGVVVENFIVSTRQGDKDVYRNNIYMDDYFSKGSSRYIYATAVNFPKGFSGVVKLSGGLSANDSVTAGDLMMAWDMFSDRESLIINTLIAGCSSGETAEISSTVQKHVVSIADERKDCLVLISPPRSTMVNIPLIRAIDNIIDWRTGKSTYDTANMNISSTYAFIDGNYKYQYDKYNDVNRWVPLAGDIAGLIARNDTIAYPWNSFAGYNRGQLLNCIKLAIEPKQSHRDRLYQEAINPVVGFSGGDGFILFGDKTATKVQTPFDRVNVRRLFNMLKINIGGMSKYKLFENNDDFTRSSFRMETTQYLDRIKALGGTYGFRVVCDTTNNTPQVIDSNGFVASFYIKPAKSINFITLNFVSTETGADFDEIIGPVN